MRHIKRHEVETLCKNKSYEELLQLKKQLIDTAIATRLRSYGVAIAIVEARIDDALWNIQVDKRAEFFKSLSKKQLTKIEPKLYLVGDKFALELAKGTVRRVKR